MGIEYSASIRLTSSQMQTIEDSILKNGNYNLFESHIFRFWDKFKIDFIPKSFLRYRFF
ncbi:hypothetical protein LEP1GSC062_2863 [Leptospira alexanderi serovar Manhao 3 str. L 60]|uniref:Uncharacterized protein n=1 Tax=Leptospira alexanderi serovar Manhao 3 str. L 60 TaxID=1049759 RepID=V6I7N1_9LEPT|nr:hypothetical protein LEP1GSC062_2863 [Leptospira alexanderi serovar Manhao 3 str. L 60]